MIVLTSQFASGLPYFVVCDCTSCRGGGMNEFADTVKMTSYFASGLPYFVASDCTSCRVGAMS